MLQGEDLQPSELLRHYPRHPRQHFTVATVTLVMAMVSRGYQSAHSKCGSFDARDLDEEFPNVTADEVFMARRHDKGG